jgi:ABC-type Mn2+/Zn2+ transport system ATPase subunit
VLGLLRPVAGQVRRDPGNLPLAYVPQRTSYDPIVPLQAETVVRMGLERDRSLLVPGFARRREHRVAEAMAAAGAADLAGRCFRTLSEGQKQKILLARVLVGRPALAFFDEPTAAMDVVSEAEALEQLDDLRRECGIGLVVVSHFLRVAARYADQVLFLDREGAVALDGPPKEVFAHPAFTRRYGDHARAALEER